MVHSNVTIVYTCKTNDFPCIVLMQRKHVEPFDVPHIHRRRLNCDPQFREWEERISRMRNISVEEFQLDLNDQTHQLIDIPHYKVFEGHPVDRTHPETV